MLDSSTLKFLSEKIDSNPEFEKMLSDEERKAVMDFRKQSSEKQVKKTNYKLLCEKRDKYSYYDSADFFNRMYWYENGIAPKSIITCRDRYCITDLSKEEFNNIISAWINDENAVDPFEDGKHYWDTINVLFYITTKEIVGDLIDTLSPRERFQICWYPPYTCKGTFGDIEKHEARLGTIDVLRGVGEYGIMNDDAYSKNSYFNKHYFHSMSEKTNVEDIQNEIRHNYNFFTKSPKDKFAICKCSVDSDGKITFLEKSEVMTYEQHFERLFGFNPLSKVKKD